MNAGNSHPGTELWNADVPIGTPGPVPIIANAVLFTGGLDGTIRAHRTVNGSLLWIWRASAGESCSAKARVCGRID